MADEAKPPQEPASEKHSEKRVNDLNKEDAPSNVPPQKKLVRFTMTWEVEKAKELQQVKSVLENFAKTSGRDEVQQLTDVLQKFGAAGPALKLPRFVSVDEIGPQPKDKSKNM